MDWIKTHCDPVTDLPSPLLVNIWFQNLPSTLRRTTRVAMHIYWRIILAHKISKRDFSRLSRLFSSSGQLEVLDLSDPNWSCRSKDIREGCGKRKDPKVAFTRKVKFTFRSPCRRYISSEIDFFFRLRLRAAPPCSYSHHLPKRILDEIDTSNDDRWCLVVQVLLIVFKRTSAISCSWRCGSILIV